MKRIIVMVQDKETKGTVRYEASDDAALINTVYLRKFGMEGKRPREIKVTVEWED